MSQIFYQSTNIGEVKGVKESPNNTLKIHRLSFLKDRMSLFSNLSSDVYSNLDPIVKNAIFDISFYNEICPHGDTVKLYRDCKILNYTNATVIGNMYVLQNVDVSY